MVHYPTIYSDKSGKVKTTMYNMFSENGSDCLELVVDGIHFMGSSFDSFELKNPESYPPDKLKRFTLNKVPVEGSVEFVFELCNCSIDLHIPQIIDDLEDEIEVESDLRLLLKLGTPSANGGISGLIGQFTLTFGKQKFTSESDDFGTALAQIQKEMMPAYRFKNCFSCHYSDYSPAGNGFFASLMCFRNNKAAYLTANKKEDFFKLAMEGYVSVQETYLCDQYAPREKNTGYRGWPFDS